MNDVILKQQIILMSGKAKFPKYGRRRETFFAI